MYILAYPCKKLNSFEFLYFLPYRLGINSVQLLGYVGQEPRVRESESSRVVTFGLATTKYFRSGPGDDGGKLNCFVISIRLELSHAEILTN